MKFFGELILVKFVLRRLVYEHFFDRIAFAYKKINFNVVMYLFRFISKSYLVIILCQ